MGVGTLVPMGFTRIGIKLGVCLLQPPRTQKSSLQLRAPAPGEQ